MPIRPPVHRAPSWRPYVKPVSAQTAFYATSAWQRLRAQVLARDGHRCTWLDRGVRCGSQADTAHHVVARADGGADSLENLRSVCRLHHALAHPEKGGRR